MNDKKDKVVLSAAAKSIVCTYLPLDELLRFQLVNREFYYSVVPSAFVLIKHKFNIFFIDSEIITNQLQKKQIFDINFIDDNFLQVCKIKKLQLIYRSNDEKFKDQDFEKKSEFQGKIFAIFKLASEDGQKNIVYGGFSQIPWNSKKVQQKRDSVLYKLNDNLTIEKNSSQVLDQILTNIYKNLCSLGQKVENNLKNQYKINVKFNNFHENYTPKELEIFSVQRNYMTKSPQEIFMLDKERSYITNEQFTTQKSQGNMTFEKINENAQNPVNLNDPRCIFMIKSHEDGSFSFGQVDMQSGLAQGIARRHYKYGIYQGQFVDGKKEGYGRLIYNDGSFYEGKWIDDQYQGQGIEVSKQNDLYEGQWKKGLKDGFGKLKINPSSFDIRDFYECEWKQGKLVQGKLFFRNGDLFTGTWIFNGKLREGTLEDAEGKLIKQDVFHEF